MRDKLKTIVEILWMTCIVWLLAVAALLLMAIIQTKESYNLWYRDCTTKILQDLNHNK